MAKIDPAITKERSEKIKALYKKGYSTEQIMAETGVSRYSVYYYVDKAKREEKPTHARTISEETERKMIGEAVTVADIAAVRKKIKVGDIIPIKTVKKLQGSDVKKMYYGAKTNAVVVDTSYKRHCVVELETGIRESVLWIAIVMALRTGKTVGL